MSTNNPEIYNTIIKGANTSIEQYKKEIAKYEEICELVDSLFNGVHDAKTLLDILTKLNYSGSKDLDFLQFCADNGLNDLPTDQYNALITKLREFFKNYKNFHMRLIDNKQSIIDEILMKFTTEELIRENILELKNYWAHLDMVTERDVIKVLLEECIKTTNEKENIVESELSDQQEETIEEIDIEDKEIKNDEKKEKRISSKVFKPKAEALVEECLHFADIYNSGYITEIMDNIETLIGNSADIKEKFKKEIDRSRELYNKLIVKSDMVEYAANQLIDLINKGYKNNYDVIMEKYDLLEEDYESFESLISEYLELFEIFRKELVVKITKPEEIEIQPEIEPEIIENTPEEITEEEPISEEELNLFTEAKMIVDNAIIPNDRGDLEWYKDRLVMLMNQDELSSNDIVEMNEYINLLSPFMKIDDIELDITNVEEINGVGPKNIILFMRNKDDSFTLTSDIESLDGSAVTEARSNIMKTLEKFANRSLFNEIRKNNKLHHIVSESGNKYYVRDKNDRARAFAVNSKGSKKISLYLISVCPENREKLKEQLHLPDLEGVILIGGYTDNHDIGYLGSEIGANRNYIIEIDEMFKDPNANIEDLLRIINESSTEFVKLDENNKQI